MSGHRGDTESIITFRDLATGALATRHCFGNNLGGQVADGLRQLAGHGSGAWVIETRSTPASILNDLRRTAP